ncbi:MAG: hypothetical protein JO316_17825 [Abitibacteriaceae bacterium]|nr:hypothetical protein [Abditibacteriaceae bacterium]
MFNQSSRFSIMAVVTGLMLGATITGSHPIYAQAGRNQVSTQQQDRMIAMWDRALHLSAEQKAKIRPILTTATVNARLIYSNRKLSPEAAQAQMQDAWKTAQAQVRTILTPAQRKKLDQLQQQAVQNEARHRQSQERFNQELKLTPQQQSQIHAITRQASVQARDLANNKSLSEPQKQAKYLNLRSTTDARIQKILTPAQRQKLAAMKADTIPRKTR